MLEVGHREDSIHGCWAADQASADRRPGCQTIVTLRKCFLTPGKGGTAGRQVQLRNHACAMKDIHDALEGSLVSRSFMFISDLLA